MTSADCCSYDESRIKIKSFHHNRTITYVKFHKTELGFIVSLGKYIFKVNSNILKRTHTQIYFGVEKYST